MTGRQWHASGMDKGGSLVYCQNTHADRRIPRHFTMARYITRVELHDAKVPRDTDALQKAMLEEGFVATIKGKRPLYRLRTGEFYRDEEVPIADVLEFAKNAAERTGRRFSILVSEAPNSTWFHLLPAKQDT